MCWLIIVQVIIVSVNVFVVNHRASHAGGRSQGDRRDSLFPTKFIVWGTKGASIVHVDFLCSICNRVAIAFGLTRAP
jgi:hypothetical protein